VKSSPFGAPGWAEGFGSLYDEVTRIGMWSDFPLGKVCLLCLVRPRVVAWSMGPRKNL
jgi:hypothetical protein